MKLKVNVIKKNPCELIIQDHTPYLKEEDRDLQVYDTFKISERVGIDVVQKNTLEGTSIYEYSVSTGVDPVKISLEFDGWVTIFHIVIPTYDWVLARLNEGDSILSYYDTIYFYHDTKFYKIVNSKENGLLQSIEVPIEEIVEVNTHKRTISKFSQDFIFICLLENCYINLCKQIMEKGCLRDCADKSFLADLIFKRDWVWMTMNVINYLIESNQFEEAQRIIETTGGCNGLCQEELANSKTGGCGCAAKI